MKKSSLFKRKRWRRKKPIWKHRFFRYLIPVLIISSVLLYLICFASFFQVEGIEILGSKEISAEKIKSLVEKRVQTKVLSFSSKSIFLIPFKKIEKDILTEFPPIQKIDFDRDFPDRLIVSVEQRKPVAVFLQKKNHFLMDPQGVIFKRIEQGKTSQFLKVKNLTLRKEAKLGDQVVDSKELSQILQIDPQLEDLDILSAEIVNEQRVNFKTSLGWEIYISLKEDISQQIFNLETVLKEKISPEERKELEYIDLRFGNRVYYK